MGRRKIDIAKINDRVKRNTTFSKRRSGLFQKAADFCVLSGAQLAIFVFSAKGSLFSFGHSSVDAIVEHYCNDTTPTPVDANETHKLMALQDSIREIKHKMNIEETQKRQRKTSKRERGFWWENIYFDEFQQTEKIHCLNNSLMKLRENVSKRMREVASSQGATISPSATSDANRDGVRVPWGLCNDIGSASTIIDVGRTLPIVPSQSYGCSNVDDYMDITNVYSDLPCLDINFKPLEFY